MHGTRLSSQPKLPQEEDRESGIGSTLDLCSSFEGHNQHTNQHSSKPAFRETDRLPKQKGTRAAFGGEFLHSCPALAAGLMGSKKAKNSSRSQTTCSLDKDMLKDTQGQ